MPDRIEFSVAGTPRARPRERHGAMINRKTGKAMSFTYRPTKIRINKKTGKPTPESLAWSRAEAWYNDVRWAVREFLPDKPWTGPVRCTIEIYFERPQYMLKKKWPDGPIWHTATPDRDNSDKSVLDALTKAGLWEDDAQVCDGWVRKFYAARGCGPGVIIVAERIGEEGTQRGSDTGTQRRSDTVAQRGSDTGMQGSREAEKQMMLGGAS